MPANFWEDPAIADAVNQRRPGMLLRAYRSHPWHGHVVSQATLARWLNLSQSRLSRIELGRIRCRLEELQHIAAALHIPPALQWFTPAPAQTPHVASADGVIAMAARDSLAFTSTLAGLPDRSTDLWSLRADLSLLATEYVHKPLENIFADLVEARNTAITLLTQRLRPTQERDAYFLAGTACLLLAHAAQNAGDPRSAQHQLKAAKDLAEVADHDALRAWVYGTSALLHEWTRRHKDAVTLARQGQTHATSVATRTRLLAIEARAAARGGDHHTATAAIRQLAGMDAHATDDDVTELGGVLSFPDVKRTYYLGSTYGLLGEHTQAAQHAEAALVAYQTGPAEDRSYGDETLARLDIVNARIAEGSIDEAHDAIDPILALPAALRIRQLDNALERTRALALELGRRGDAAALDLGHSLSTTPATPAPLLSQRAFPPP